MQASCLQPSTRWDQFTGTKPSGFNVLCSLPTSCGQRSLLIYSLHYRNWQSLSAVGLLLEEQYVLHIGYVIKTLNLLAV